MFKLTIFEGLPSKTKQCVMKKVLTLVTAIMVVLSFENTANAQAASQGNIIIDPYYGFPNFGKSFAKNFESETSSNFKVKGLGPLGLRGEYMVADRMGVGFDVIYNSYDLQYTDVRTDSIYDGNTNTWTTKTTSTDNEYKMQRLRVHLRFNYHFEVSNPMLDAYFGVGAGSNNRFRKAYENGVEVKDDTDLGKFTLLPVSLRICTGLRYYFTENIGINAELGLGGPLISAGVSLKF